MPDWILRIPRAELIFGVASAIALGVLYRWHRARRCTDSDTDESSLQLAQTGNRLFGELRRRFRTGLSDDYLRILEESLISGDVGVATTEWLISELKSRSSAGGSVEELETELRTIMSGMFDERDGSPLAGPLEKGDALTVVALVGVNGAGKTTTAGKLAYQFSTAGKKVVLGACDTFRAAAPEQLKIWAERSGAEIVFGSEGMKPSTVAFRALEAARTTGAELLILDTAGRLHTKSNLMQELQAVLGAVSKDYPGAPHETLLVVDATNGQNALEQARAFHKAAPLTGLVVTKLDGTPRGGMLFAIRKELGVPVRYIGVGEKAENLVPFQPEQFLDSIFSPSSIEDERGNESSGDFASKVTRKRR